MQCNIASDWLDKGKQLDSTVYGFLFLVRNISVYLSIFLSTYLIFFIYLVLSVGTHFIFPNSIFKNNPSTIQWTLICLIVHTGSLPVITWNFICKFGINIWSTVAKKLKSMAGGKKSCIFWIRNLLIEEELKPHLLFSLF